MKIVSLILSMTLLGSLSLVAEDIATDGKKADKKMAAEASGNLSADEVRFVMKAAKAGHSEAAVGELAKSGAERGDVKSFGDTLVDHHTAINKELAEIAEKNGVTLPDMGEKGKDMAGKLAKLQGAEFDNAFLKQMVAAHEKDVALFKKAQETVKDEDLKKFVDNTLPKLEDHLAKAKELMKEKAEDAAEKVQS